jgi:catechol 2,3-dioxygenase-like lactoylglutathione lyase family enzyme
MEGKSKWVHTGVTVSDIDKTVEFYSKYFGFTKKMQIVFNEDFIAAKPSLYRQAKGVYSKMAMIESPDGVSIELFEFVPQLPAELDIWNKPGYHHICLQVPDLNELYKVMAADGVKFFFEPDHMGPPTSKSFWVFLQDPDGNMIELQSHGE